MAKSTAPITTDDVPLTIAASLLAMSAAGFAIYMLATSGEPVPTQMVLSNTTAPLQGAVLEQDVDTIITGSLPAPSLKSNAADKRSDSILGQNYRLQTVHDAHAYIIIEKPRRSTIASYQVGMEIPGLGTLTAITTQQGEWLVKAERGEITRTGLRLYNPKPPTIITSGQKQ